MNNGTFGLLASRAVEKDRSPKKNLYLLSSARQA
jgi:hypothetical protein